MSCHDHGVGGIGRRNFFAGAAGTLASTCLIGSVEGAPAAASTRSGRRRGVAPAPNPIPGGLEIAPGTVIHTFAPGDPSITLPFTGGVLGGFDVEPGTIIDFDGASAVAYHVGSVRGSNRVTYNLETDMRAFEGDYLVDGVAHHGSFVFV
jgi:hypothetical protein